MRQFNFTTSAGYTSQNTIPHDPGIAQLDVLISTPITVKMTFGLQGQGDTFGEFELAQSSSFPGATGVAVKDASTAGVAVQVNAWYQRDPKPILIAAGATNVVTALGYVQQSPSDPAGTTSTSIGGVMMGLAIPFTPSTGTVFATITGTMDQSTTTNGRGVAVQGRYGTGAAPVNGAASAGTAFASFKENIVTASANPRVGFTAQAMIAGLTVGTAYWFDLALKAIVAGTATVYDLDATVMDFAV